MAVIKYFYRSKDENILRETKRIKAREKYEHNGFGKKVLEVNASTVTRWENNLRVPVIDQLYQIAVFFGVSSDYLIGLED